MDIKLLDTTLRDGEQAPGISFSFKEKVDIAESLINLGIDEIEAGIPIMGIDSFNFVKYLANLKIDTKISAWSRFRLKDVKQAAKTGVEIIHISIPISDYHLPNQLGSWETILKDFKVIINFAKENFNHVSIGLQDSFRANPGKVLELCNLCQESKLYRIRFSDTVGNSFPQDVGEFVKTYRKVFTGLIDFHGHNDLGLATANSLAAIESGVDSVNVTINGIGERAGNTALEQMAFVLDLNPKFSTRVKLEKLKPLNQKVSEYTNRKIPLDRPIVGANVFTHESGIHCHGLLKNPLAYQPFRPEDKGLESSKLVVGTHSGKSNIINILKNEGIEFKSRNSRNSINAFRLKAFEKRDFLTTDEVVKIYKELNIGSVL